MAIGNRTIKQGDASFSWDDEHLFFMRNGVEEWRLTWTAISRVVISANKPTTYIFTSADGNEFREIVGSFRWLKLETLLTSMDIEVIIGRTNKPTRKRRWTLKNHLLYGAKPNPNGKPVAFRYIEGRVLMGMLWFQLAFYAFAVLELSFFTAGLVYVVILGNVNNAPLDERLELSFVVAFGLTMLGVVAFFARAFVVSLRSLKTRKLGLRFERNQVEIVDGDRLLPAQIETRRLWTISEYLVVRAGDERYCFSLLMAQE
jgi:hypothetical protein